MVHFVETNSQQDRVELNPGEVFKNKINSEEAIPIKNEIVDFFIDFEQKSINDFFKSPDEQSQYLREFIRNISLKVIENPLWASSDRIEQESALVEIEKLITKGVFDITFRPPEDEKREKLFSQKILMYSWIEPKHFDLPEFDYNIFGNAVNELCKMNSYKFYIDKIICLLNCMALINYNYRRNVSNEELDEKTFIKLLIFVILKTNPDRLFSNVIYILRYINPSYYSINIYEKGIAIICEAITFIEKIPQTCLTMLSEEEYNT